jgi:transaldolase
MRFFLDSANLEEVRTAASWGVLSGVTTNPSLVAKEGDGDFPDRIRTIASLVEGPISAEVTDLSPEGMLRQGRELAALAPGVVIKIPMNREGTGAVRALAAEGIRTNVTLVFSPQQALLAAAAGASFVSPFVGRLDDIGEDGIGLIAEIAEDFSIHRIATEIIAASIRHPKHVSEAARAGAHIATVPFGVLKSCFAHPLTEAGIRRFVADWENRGQVNAG